MPSLPTQLALQRRRLCVGGLAAGLSAAAGRAVASAAPRELTWHDSRRARELALWLRVPAAPGPWPLVLHSHGLGGSRAGGEAWGRAWSEAGIAVLHLQHPGSDIELLRSGLAGGRDALQALRAGADARQLIARVDDVRFVLDELARLQRTGEAPWRELQLDRVGFSGHSFGARTAQVLAGERFAQGRQLAEPRLVAFIALSPSQGRLPLAESFGDIRRPFLAVTGSHDADPFGAFADGEVRARVYDGLPASGDGRRALLWLAGADHTSFGGGTGAAGGRDLLRRAPGAAAAEAAHQARVAQVGLWWWQRWLLGDAAAAEALQRLASATPPHPLLAPGDRFTLG